jgi:hypothetical protein
MKVQSYKLGLRLFLNCTPQYQITTNHPRMMSDQQTYSGAGNPPNSNPAPSTSTLQSGQPPTTTSDQPPRPANSNIGQQSAGNGQAAQIRQPVPFWEQDFETEEEFQRAALMDRIAKDARSFLMYMPSMRERETTATRFAQWLVSVKGTPENLGIDDVGKMFRIWKSKPAASRCTCNIGIQRALCEHQRICRRQMLNQYTASLPQPQPQQPQQPPPQQQ